MKSNILLLLFITLSVTALAEVDSILVAGPPLSGEIHTCNENYEPEVFFLGMGAGDTGIPLIPPYIANATERAYLTFPIDSLNNDTEIDSCVLRFRAYYTGNDNLYVWPIWNIAGGDTVKLCLDHVNFGNELDVGDWTAGDYSDIQTLTTKYKYIYPEDQDEELFFFIDVTEAINYDIQAENEKSQFRIRFEIFTDEDNLSDNLDIAFWNTETVNKPFLFVYYQNTDLKEEFLMNEISLINYPNPFNPITQISYFLSFPSYIKIEIYNIKGEKVNTLINEYQSTGEHSVIWDAEKHSSGIYFYKLVSGKQIQTGKCLLIK